MNIFKFLAPELRFIAYDRVFVVWLIVVLCFSSMAVWSGLSEVRYQSDTIERLIEIDKKDRAATYSDQGDWGSAAYYSFHFTYDPPSEFAFAAMGQRDGATWKHRVRTLALEGQIYEHDAGNPELALIGRFDFAFFIAFVVSLILIFLFHDSQANERVAGRFELLVATAGGDGSLWRRRAILKSAGILIAALLPLIIVSVVSGTAFLTLLIAIGYVIAYFMFWTLVCNWFASWKRSAPVILSSLIGIWILLSAILPAGGRVIIDRMVSVPSGSEILMTQREAVNEAWDLPVEETMLPFYDRYPEWKGYIKTGEGFDWGWYFAFQQVGDQETEKLSSAYFRGRLERDRLAGLLVLLAPPALLERSLQKLARTDVSSSLAYETEVRQFHPELKDYYYPRLFREEPFDSKTLAELPQFVPAG